MFISGIIFLLYHVHSVTERYKFHTLELKQFKSENEIAFDNIRNDFIL